MTQSFAGMVVPGAIAAVSTRAARWFAVLAMALGSSGCLLTSDLPDPALDVPPGYKSAGTKNPMDAPPTLDWWRGFRSGELTVLMEEAQTVNLDIAAATARFIQADAQARIAGAPLFPSLSTAGQESYSRTSGSSASGLSNGGREIVNYQASLSASFELDFWGKNRDAAQAAEETAIANRFDRDVVALTTLTSVANAYFTVLSSQDRLRVAERNIASAQRILDAINRYAGGRYRAQIAFERDFRTIVLSKPRHIGPVRFLAEIGELVVEPDTPARVVINERTGTVVIGRDVRISTVAVTHGNLTVRVTEMPVVSQPAPFSRGQTVVVPQTVVEANEAGSQVAILNGVDLQRLVRGLNQIGLKPSGIIAILQAIKTAGALQADVIVQ